MRIVKVGVLAPTNKGIPLGVQGENRATDVEFDTRPWFREYPSGTVSAVARRNGDPAPYPLTLDVEDGTAVWKVSDTDTAKAGEGAVELTMTSAGTRVRSLTFKTLVTASLTDAPVDDDAWYGWLDKAVVKVDETVQAAQRKMAEVDEEWTGLKADVTAKVDECGKAAAQAAEDAHHAKVDAQATAKALESAESSVAKAEAAAKRAEDAMLGADDSAVEASRSALSAWESAEAAAGSATSAATSASEAATSARNAADAASAASDSASAAEQSATDASNAKAAAQTAKAEAETAKSEAATSATYAEKSANDAKAAVQGVDAKIDAATAEATAELIDIRTGYDGTVYATAGDAVRGQTGDLSSILTETVYPAGDHFTTGGTMKENNRIWSAKKRTGKGTLVSLEAPGYRMCVVEYNDDGHILIDTNWITGKYMVQNDCMMSVGISKSNDSSLTDLSEFNGKVKVTKNRNAEEVVYLSSAHEELSEKERSVELELMVNSGSDVFIRLPEMKNGSAPNPGNESLVNTGFLNVEIDDALEFVTDRPLTDGHRYCYGLRVKASGVVMYEKDINSSMTCPVLAIHMCNGCGTKDLTAGITVGEYDADGNNVALRKDDFDGYIVAVVVHKAHVDSMALDAVGSMSGYVTTGRAYMINGSWPNVENANAVHTNAIRVDGGETVTVVPKRGPEKGSYCYGWYAFDEDSNLVLREDARNDIVNDKKTLPLNARYVCCTVFETYRADDGSIKDNTIRIENGDYEFLTVLKAVNRDNSIPVVVRNEDVLPQVNAAGNHGWSEAGKFDKNKCLSMLVVTDIHRCSVQASNAVSYLNAIDGIDCGMCLGDIAAGNYSETDGTWYTNAVKSSKKPFYTAIGNHDGGNSASASISGTKAQQFAKFVEPTLDVMGMSDLTKTYYKVDFSNYPVTLIVLDVFDVPDTKLDDGNFAVSRAVEAVSQEQLDWFVQALKSVPSGNHLVVSMHTAGNLGTWTSDECAWTNPGSKIASNVVAYSKIPIADIVEAWRNGTSIRGTYAPTSYTGYMPTLTVDADFSERGAGIFACYLCGHAHYDTVAHDQNGQLCVQLDCAANDNWQAASSDLPRVSGTKTEDCMTVVGVDTARRLVKLVRVGSNVTMSMTKRGMIALSY